MKSVFNPNAKLKNNFGFYVEGIPRAARTVDFGDLTSEIAKVERRDKTTVLSGRTNPGETEITVLLADDITFDQFRQWHEMGIDKTVSYQNASRNNVLGAENYSIDFQTFQNPFLTNQAFSRPGIDLRYKRQVLIYQYPQSSQNNPDGAGDFGISQPSRTLLLGACISKITKGGGDIGSDDEVEAKMTIGYDDIIFIPAQV